MLFIQNSAKKKTIIYQDWLKKGGLHIHSNPHPKEDLMLLWLSLFIWSTSLPGYVASFCANLCNLKLLVVAAIDVIVPPCLSLWKIILSESEET